MTSAPKSRSRESGFTLIEVIVSFAIVALTLVPLFQIFSAGLRSSIVAENYTVAVLLAESKLAGIGIEEPLEEGDRSGAFDNGFHWTTSVRPYGDGGAAVTPGMIQAFEVAVTVRWDGPAHERSVSLTTLQLMAEP